MEYPQPMHTLFLMLYNMPIGSLIQDYCYFACYNWYECALASSFENLSSTQPLSWDKTCSFHICEFGSNVRISLTLIMISIHVTKAEMCANIILHVNCHLGLYEIFRQLIRSKIAQFKQMGHASVPQKPIQNRLQYL